MIKVAMVEDDKELAASMMALLQTAADIHFVSVFANAEDLVKQFKSLNVDVVLMDISLPGMSGIQCVAQLKPVKPQVQFLMCTSHNESEKTFDALCAGATGYILKNSSLDNLVDAIRDINRGGSPMSAEIARLVVSSFPDKQKNTDLLQSFTTREQEILYALAKGYQYKEIADQLFISIETVRTYLRKIYDKLHVHSKVEALNKVFPKNFKD
jgi:DNA-binding NarL/FixJ family response regulator